MSKNEAVQSETQDRPQRSHKRPSRTADERGMSLGGIPMEIRVKLHTIALMRECKTTDVTIEALTDIIKKYKKDLINFMNK